MPNIEIYDRKSSTAPHNLKKRIDKIMQGAGLGDETITTIIDSLPESCTSRKNLTPFIRICYTDADRIAKIIQILKYYRLRVDVETLILNDFILAKEMG